MKGVKYAQTLSATHMYYLMEVRLLIQVLCRSNTQSENELLAQVLKVGAVGPVYYNEKQEIYDFKIQGAIY
jgi:hypothetical protein